MCMRPAHITYYKSINTRANAGFTSLLYVHAHTHEPNALRQLLFAVTGDGMARLWTDSTLVARLKVWGIENYYGRDSNSCKSICYGLG